MRGSIINPRNDETSLGNITFPVSSGVSPAPEHCSVSGTRLPIHAQCLSAMFVLLIDLKSKTALLFYSRPPNVMVATSHIASRTIARNYAPMHALSNSLPTFQMHLFRSLARRTLPDAQRASSKLSLRAMMQTWTKRRACLCLPSMPLPSRSRQVCTIAFNESRP